MVVAALLMQQSMHLLPSSTALLQLECNDVPRGERRYAQSTSLTPETGSYTLLSPCGRGPTLW
jgi:hypothetical protein